MFPIRDHNPSERFPIVTIGLIAVNIVVFLYSFPLAGDARALASFYYDWATVPALVSDGQQVHTIFTSMFLHGGILHLAGNMLFLWIFGDNLEDTFGPVWFLIFYLTCGIAADFAHIAADPSSQIPTVGASGAIAGVMGGYLLLFPKAKIDMIFFIFVFFKRFTLPAWTMLAVWFGLQVFGGFGADTSQGGVAYWAHAGGFVAGFLLTLPVFFARHGTDYWRKTDGHPPHPPTYEERPTSIPTVQRRRR